MTIQQVGKPKLQAFHLSFCSDLTRENVAAIPLGFLMEATWGREARWLGLLGRYKLEEHENALINLKTWPELSAPHTLLSEVFECGWSGNWGEAASRVSEKWRSSALIIEGRATGAIPAEYGNIHDDTVWDDARSWLGRELRGSAGMLTPKAANVHSFAPRRLKSEVLVREDHGEMRQAA